jgi:TolB-like protein/Flp pilus assembly protein TadD
MPEAAWHSPLSGPPIEGGAAHVDAAVAVLPLRNLSSDIRDEALCAGITSDIIHGLTRFRDLGVIAQHSALRIKALALAPRALADRLGIRYVLIGDLRRFGDQLEIDVRLLEAASERVIWSMAFAGRLGDVFAFQDEVTEVVAGNLAIEIRAAEHRRAVDAAPSDLSAYDLILRAELLIHRYRRVANRRARLLLERAQRADPGYARCYAALSRTFNLDWRYAWSPSPSAALDRSLELAKAAISHDPFDARAHSELGFVLLCRKQHDAALDAYARALELNPNDADILAEHGDALTAAGANEQALAALTRAMRLNPFCPDWYRWYLGSVYFHLGDYQRAIDVAAGMHDLSEVRRLLAASYAHLGRMDEARHHAVQLKIAHPNFSLAHWQNVSPFKDPEPLERLIEGLRKAGLE